MILGTLREELTEALRPLDLNTYAHIPGRLALPAAFVAAGAPYIEQGQTFGERLVRFQVVLATQTGENGAETEALDELIENAQAVLESDGWAVETVDQPYQQTANSGEFLATVITVTSTVTFTKEQ